MQLDMAVTGCYNKLVDIASSDPLPSLLHLILDCTPALRPPSGCTLLYSSRSGSDALHLLVKFNQDLNLHHEEQLESLQHV